MNGGYPHEVPLPNMYVFNPVSNKWSVGASIPQARRRGSAGAVVYKNKIYLVAGITDGHWAGWVPWFDEYDPATNTWRTLPDAPRSRDHFHATVVNDKLYLAGGRRSSGSTGQVFALTVPEVDVYDFVTGTWSTLPSSSNLPTPRAGAASVLLGNELMVIGGEDNQTAGHKETHALDVTTNTWRRVADLQESRHGTQAIVNNNGIYIAVGAGNQGSGPLVTSQEAFYLYGPTVLSGTALSQSQLAGAASLDYGLTATNVASTKTLTLTNTGGNQAILVSSIAIGGAASFSYTVPFSMPFVIPVGKSVDLTVKFQPTAGGTQSANLVVTHSGQIGTTTTALSGAGSTATGPPVANAGPNQTLTLPTSSAVLAGAGTAAGNTVAGYAWSQSSGPTTAAIAGTANGALSQTERYGPSGLLSYALPVANGSYTVVLHFAEIYWTAAGKRVFDVSLENARVLSGYDIYKKVGAFAATTETFPVTVTDGVLNLDFTSRNPGGVDNPKIAAIQVLGAGASSTAAHPLAFAAAPSAAATGPAQAYPTPTPDGRVQVRWAGPVAGRLHYTLVSPLGAVLAQGERALAQPTDVLDFDFAAPMAVPGAYYLLLRAPGADARLKLLRR